MNAYHITGALGSGKSHVGRELGKRGFRVIETDFEPGLSDWANKETRQKVEEPAQPFPAEWVEAHGWYWAQLDDRDIDLAATLTHIQKSGFDVPSELIEKIDPNAFHWMAGFWFNQAVTPIWEGGPEGLRDFQLLSGLTALRLAEARQ
jgi:hypothetical protein